jgi:hypothetical protein
MLPASGRRSNSSGSLSYRGYDGYYWSSSLGTSSYAWGLHFDNGGAGTYTSYRRGGLSVRCVAE